MNVRFEDPWIFAVALLSAGCLWIFRRRRVPLPISSMSLFDGLRRESWRTRLRTLPMLLRAVWLVLLVIAAARPQFEEPTQRPLGQGTSLFFVIDVSGSMDLPSVEQRTPGGISRLEKLLDDVTTLITSDFIQDADQLGIIVFAESARILSPLTTDRSATLSFLEQVEIDRRADRTNIGDALALAVSHLSKIPSSARRIVLFTDGGQTVEKGLRPSEGARLAEAYGIAVDAVYLGETGDPSASSVEAMKSVARITGGQFHAIGDWTPHNAQGGLLTKRVAVEWTDAYRRLLLAALLVWILELAIRTWLREDARVN